MNRAVLLVCLPVFGLMAGQQMLNPILPPLARQLGFSELALGLVWTVGASGVVLTSPFWSRRAAARGHRPVLLLSLVGAAAALLAFAVVARIGLTGALAVPVVFALVLLTRGVLFGLAWAATPVTAQSYVADVTEGEAERVRGMSALGAAQGLALAVGPALGAALSAFGLLAPLYAAPLVIAVIAVLVRVGLPAPAGHRARPPAVAVSPFDRRMWPFLLTGFGMYLALGVVLMTIGFLVQDRLHLSAQDTGPTTGLVMLAGAGMIIVVQAAAVPRLRWAPPRLIRVGAVVMTAGMAVVAVAGTAPLLAAGLALLGAGMGFGMPGFTAAPTLRAGPAEQGSVAALVGSTTALTFMLGPLVGTGLYEIAPAAPYVLGVVLLAALAAFTFLHPGVRPARAAVPGTAPSPGAVGHP